MLASSVYRLYSCAVKMFFSADLERGFFLVGGAFCVLDTTSGGYLWNCSFWQLALF